MINLLILFIVLYAAGVAVFSIAFKAMDPDNVTPWPIWALAWPVTAYFLVKAIFVNKK